MSILAVGDSFTFGAELPDVPMNLGYHGNDYYNEKTHQQEIASPSKYAWPALLAKKLNTDVVNLGLVGGSNDRIFRLAVKETVKKKYDLVVCAWTSVDRFDVTLNGNDLALSAGTSTHWRKEFPWVTEYVANHYNREFSEEKWLTQVLALQAYFDSIDQPYLFVKSIIIPITTSNLFLTKQINLQNCVEWNSSMQQWCVGCPIGDDGHFLEEGHELVAEKVFKFLQERSK